MSASDPATALRDVMRAVVPRSRWATGACERPRRDPNLTEDRGGPGGALPDL